MTRARVRRKLVNPDPETGAIPIIAVHWNAPDYTAIWKRRAENLVRIREHPELRGLLKEHYAENPWDFISDWGVTFDPRNKRLGLPTIIPMVLFPKQVEWCRWVFRKWKNGEDGLCEKSRDMGVSWLAMAMACALCIFNEGIAIGVGSRKTEYVDKIGTFKPLLPKARMFMKYLPPEFQGGWQDWRDAPYMRLLIPETGSLIAGEGGDDLGRGDRAQPLDAVIYTPLGPKLMGEIAVGDYVLGSDGAPTKVLGVYDRGKRQVYRVIFNDGSSTECCDEHLWQVTTRAMRKTVKRRAASSGRSYKRSAPTHAVLQLKTIAGSLVRQRRDGQVERQYQIPVLSAPAQFAGAALPLDPYIVGALLGDGTVCNLDRTSPGFCTADVEMLEIINARLPASAALVPSGDGWSYRLSTRKAGRRPGRRSPIKDAVIAAGIGGMKGPEKRIPDLYKFSSPAERLEVLRGLLDTDGWVHWKGRTSPTVRFSSTSRGLVEDVRFIVQSLGGTTSIGSPIHRPVGSKLPRGAVRTKETNAWEIAIAMPTGLNPFRLTRKASKVRERTMYKPSRTIVAVEPVAVKPTKCIRVEASDHLYLTDHFIVTHNTSMYLVDEYAHFERPELTEAALSQTTNCRIDMSTPRGMDNPFAEKRHRPGMPDDYVFIFDWRDDPRKGEDWYAKQVARLDPVVVAQEIDRDYSASITGIVCPGIWVKACIGAREKLGIAPAGRPGLSFDVADEGKDKNALCHNVGIEIRWTRERSGKGGDIFSTVEWVYEEADKLGLAEFDYDADGLGAGVRGDSRQINETRRAAGRKAIKAVPFRGSGEVLDPDEFVEGTIGGEGEQERTNKDYYRNRKAQAWFNMRRLVRNTYRWVVEGIPCDPTEIVSISRADPEHMQLVHELSQATFQTNSAGFILINKIGEGRKSPNRADAAVMRMAKKSPEAFEVSSEMLTQVMRASQRNPYRGRRGT